MKYKLITFSLYTAGQLADQHGMRAIAASPAPNIYHFSVENIF